MIYHLAQWVFDIKIIELKYKYLPSDYWKYYIAKEIFSINALDRYAYKEFFLWLYIATPNFCVQKYGVDPNITVDSENTLNALLKSNSAVGRHIVQPVIIKWLNNAKKNGINFFKLLAVTKTLKFDQLNNI